MASIELLLAFLVTTAVFAFIPGPAMLYAAARTVAGGRRSGLMASLGIHLGGYAHVLAAASGLSLIFHAVPALYMAVKLAGAAYLVWLGISMFRAAGREQRMASLPGPKSPAQAFLQSVAVELLNPKTAIFFMAFLPQFIDGAGAFPVWLQFLILGTAVNLTFSVADIICVLMAGALVERLGRSARMRRYAERAGGTALIGLGTHLALQKA